MRSESETRPSVAQADAEVAPDGLRRRRVLVADDDAEVRWFYVGALRAAGARVVEARDGVEALRLARAEPPDLILADIIMPRLDGLGLCAAIRREPLLDGLPVVLLSWRDDFLHRMRELRVEAQGYLRKEVPAEEIIAEAARVLEPSNRLEATLKSDGEARGDVEDVGVSGLLRAIRRLRPTASLVLQDPWSLFELELHEGNLVGATRTAVDGAITKDAAVLPALVGMSSGRFVVAEPPAEPRRDERESLEPALAAETDRLGAILSAMAEHPRARLELDQDVLGAYVRHSPVRVQGMIARLAAGDGPQSLWESGAGSRALVDALLVTLARQGAVLDVVPPGAEPVPGSDPQAPSHGDSELNEPQIQQHLPPVIDPVERENARAQSAVAMHREPANRAPVLAHPIWRLQVSPAMGSGAQVSGFDLELQSTSRFLGIGFVVVLATTVVFLLWRQVMPAAGPSAARPVVVEPGEPSEPAPAEAEAIATVGADDAPPMEVEGIPGLFELSGRLTVGTEPRLGVGEGQGVLSLTGPAEVQVEVNGGGRGALPLALVLEEGRHRVRYRIGGESTVRFYYVKAGATRTLEVVTRPGGFVDAR